MRKYRILHSLPVIFTLTLLLLCGLSQDTEACCGGWSPSLSISNFKANPDRFCRGGSTSITATINTNFGSSGVRWHLQIIREDDGQSFGVFTGTGLSVSASWAGSETGIYKADLYAWSTTYNVDDNATITIKVECVCSGTINPNTGRKGCPPGTGINPSCDNCTPTNFNPCAAYGDKGNCCRSPAAPTTGTGGVIPCPGQARCYKIWHGGAGWCGGTAQGNPCRGMASNHTHDGFPGPNRDHDSACNVRGRANSCREPNSCSNNHLVYIPFYRTINYGCRPMRDDAVGGWPPTNVNRNAYGCQIQYSNTCPCP